MVVFKLPTLFLLHYLVTSVPVNTPRRKQIISERFLELTLTDELMKNSTRETLVTVEVDIGSRFKGHGFDIGNVEHWKPIEKMLMKQKIQELQTSYGPVFVPKKKVCCGKSLNLKIDKSVAGKKCRLITMSGMKSALVFKGTCQEVLCKREYFPHYEEFEIDEIKLRQYYKPENHFSSTTATVFESKYIEEIVRLVSYCSSDFTSLATTYNEIHETESGKLGSLSIETLENIFFLYKVAQSIPNVPFVINQRNDRHQDIEDFLQQAYPIMRKNLSDNWKSHRCTADKGCDLRAIIIDGNEVCHRKTCAAPVEHIEGNEGQPNFYKLCPSFPEIGKKSIYCRKHSYLNVASDDIPSGNVDDGRRTKIMKSEPVQSQYDLRPRTRKMADFLLAHGLIQSPESDKSDMGCRKEDRINKFFPATENSKETSSSKKQKLDSTKGPKKNEKLYKTTSGILSIVRTCGIRLGTWDMFTRESLSQMFLAILDKFGPNPSEDEIAIVVADVACGLHPFIESRGKQNEIFNKYAKLRYCLDTFHGDNHKKPTCLPSGEEAKYNPRLPAFKDLFGANLEAAENSFRAMNDHKSVTRYMTGAKRLVYFLIIEDMLNARLENEMTKKGQTLISGQDAGWRKKNVSVSEMVLRKGGLPGSAGPTILEYEEIVNTSFSDKVFSTLKYAMIENDKYVPLESLMSK